MVTFLIDFQSDADVLVFIKKTSEYFNVSSYEVRNNILTLRIKTKELHTACVIANTLRAISGNYQLHCDFFYMYFNA